MSSMPLVNQIEPFIPGTIPFAQFLEQLDWVFAHHKVTSEEDQKVSFLATCSREVYSELKLLFPGRDLKTVSFKEITGALRKRYDKTESDLIQRYKFYQRVQGPSESAEDFILAVKLQAEMCHFGEFKDMAIRDKLVCGISDKDLQQRLFDEEDLTLAKAEKLIVNRELAGARAKLISGNSNRNKSKTVKFVDSPAEKPKMTEYQKSLRRRLNRSVSDDEMDCMLISSINRINEPCFRNVYVDGLRLRMEVDCGAAVSVISLEMYEGDFDHIPLQRCDKKLAVINGSRLKVEGQIEVKVELNGRTKTVDLIVLRNGSGFTPLLGRDWLDVFVPDWRKAFGNNINIVGFTRSDRCRDTK
ncbi:uncharacterized protein LOC131680076 [Topomyia yanbarensis]|uniref:uncharacterized protein LOC131680076 n=1 Tax=Topomyia yanbarensis TaxID=2498891 RepID=UPI00273CCE69|nr:uncharacterized protein LOC131680076 [Topomyia yanbarensis]